MASLMDIVNQGWFGIVAGSLVGLILYHRGKRDPHISYQLSTQTLIARVPKSLKGRVSISFDDKPTEDLLSTRLVIWNSGSAAVRADSFPSGGGLLVMPEKMSDVVGYDITAVSNSLNGVKLRSQPEGIFVDLDYLNPGDGLIVDILHRSDAGKVRVNGVLLGHRRGISFEGKINEEGLKKGSLWIRAKAMLDNLWLLLGGSMFLYVGYLYWRAYIEGSVISKSMSSEQHIYGAILLIPIGIFAAILGLIEAIKPSPHPPSFAAQIPKDV